MPPANNTNTDWVKVGSLVIAALGLLWAFFATFAKGDFVSRRDAETQSAVVSELRELRLSVDHIGATVRDSNQQLTNSIDALSKSTVSRSEFRVWVRDASTVVGKPLPDIPK